MSIQDILTDVAGPLLAKGLRNAQSVVFAAFLAEYGDELKELATQRGFNKKAQRLFDRFLKEKVRVLSEGIGLLVEDDEKEKEVLLLGPGKEKDE